VLKREREEKMKKSVAMILLGMFITATAYTIIDSVSKEKAKEIVYRIIYTNTLFPCPNLNDETTTRLYDVINITLITTPKMILCILCIIVILVILPGTLITHMDKNNTIWKSACLIFLLLLHYYIVISALYIWGHRLDEWMYAPLLATTLLSILIATTAILSQYNE
jgi:hypothetical protein